jgi:hypothetical protein
MTSPSPLSPTDPPPEEERSSGPLLGLLARGLELWLRQQCDGIRELDIALEGSMAQMLRGHLQGVRLRAREVVFQDLCLEQVDLRSDPIQFTAAGLLRGRSLRLDHPFHVRGFVRFTGDGLSRSLVTPAWRDLGDHLCSELLGVVPLERVTLLDDRLVLRARPADGLAAEVETRMALSAEGLAVCPLDGRPPLPLPMDGAIALERAEVRGGQLELAGVALVRP